MRHTASRTTGAIKYIFAAAATLMLSACVSMQPVVPVSATPSATMGYVAGVFSSSGVGNYGLGLTDLAGGKEVVLSFSDLAGPLNSVPGDKATMIQLPAGRYRVSSWVTFSRITMEKISRKELPLGREGLEFTVAQGRVRYLGKFSSDTSIGGTTIRYHIEPQRITQQDLARLFASGYPNFPFQLIDAQPDSVY